MTPSITDVLVVGGAGVDTIVRVEDLEVPSGDSTGVPPIHDYVAHTGNGVARGCRALGLRTAFLDFLGDDPQGRAIEEAYALDGLDFTSVHSPHGTPRAVNLVDARGRRFSFYDGRHPADLRLPRDVWLPMVERAGHVHMSITGVNRDMYPDLHRSGVPSSTDLHDWDGDNPHHRHYALNSDLVFLSAGALEDRLEEVLHGIVHDERGRARLAVAMDGANGCHLLARGEDDVRHFPAARPGRPVVDTNGAGDAFVSGFLHAHLNGLGVEECVLAGSVSGAFACGSAGTHTEFIDLDSLRAGVAAELARTAPGTA
ncbi:carbohydrate kinase family protein [Nocardiopsis alba]|uniref:carbohydrate kinase family protein n=1 Tax=Nocardiopsis alba TaxID=53437 RepID=UPI003D702A31